MDIKSMYKRFVRLSWEQQLGNLASTLARIADLVEDAETDSLAATSLREAALQIEWSAPNVPSEYLVELAAMQREVLAWHQCWPIEDARSILALHCRNQANRLLQMASLLEASSKPAEPLVTVSTLS